MTIAEMLECINGIEEAQPLTMPGRITRCRTNPDDSISRAAKRGENTPVIKYTSSTFYNEFTLFYDID